MDFETRCIHGCKLRYDLAGAVSVPIFQSATFTHPGVGKSTGYDYSRVQNPTREYLEKTLAQLEEGTEALAFSSGMAAVTALMELFSPGDHLIASDDLYGGSRRLFDHISQKNGLAFSYTDTSDLSGAEKLIRPETRALFVETPSNPMMQVTDLAAAAELCRRYGLLLLVDNTFLTPFFQRPLKLGADVVIHSGTKYLSGHNDTLSGFLVVADAALSERLRFIYKTTGACLSPFDSWLMIRGMKTLAIRMQRQQESALRVASWLRTHGSIRSLQYVGLSDRPDYALSLRQTSGFGAMISFETDTGHTAVRLLERLRLIQYAESLGGAESLVTYPVLQTHADVPAEIRSAKGIHERLLRLSVGLESPDDLISDLQQALSEDCHETNL